MNRKIAFRAWQQYSLQMFEVTGLVWSAALSHKFSKLELLSMDGNYAVRNVAGEACDNYILMQYTGLQDCKGKDIYEGDIITKVYTSGELMAGYESIVKFGKVNPGANGYEYNYWINGFYAEIINNGIEQWKPDETVTDAMIAGEVEIIGNIHDDKDLLK